MGMMKEIDGAMKKIGDADSDESWLHKTCVNGHTEGDEKCGYSEEKETQTGYSNVILEEQNKEAQGIAKQVIKLVSFNIKTLNL